MIKLLVLEGIQKCRLKWLQTILSYSTLKDKNGQLFYRWDADQKEDGELVLLITNQQSNFLFSAEVKKKALVVMILSVVN